MPFDEEGKHSLADIVMQVWLFDSKLVEAQHAWHTWKTPRRMECFQPANLTGIAPVAITEERLAQAIKDAGDWFAKHNRGRKLYMTPRFVDNEIQISIRRGDPFSRKSTIDDDGIDTITFREARKDSMVYCLNDEVLMLNSSLKSAYADAPMGSEEMVLYFELCREVINAGWFWCKSDDMNSSLDHGDCRTDRLVSFLYEVRDSWLEQPYEGGSPPSFIIECSRRRVPRGSQVPIVGMDREEGKQHVPDCDCPICDMMASGMFGVGFASIDGHHLEIDNEFAFSTHEFIEDWQREQDEYRSFSAEMDRRQAERDARIAAGEREEDVYASAWSSPISDARIPGDSMGHLKLSFRLAEIIGDLEQAGAPNQIIKDLNVSFRDFRENEFEDKQAIRAILGQHLDAAADQYPDLLPKISDFQSQLDEQLRASP